MQLPNDIGACHRLIKKQATLLNEQDGLIRDLKRQILDLRVEIGEFKRQLRQNSRNSSKPPSSDMNKPKRKRKPALPGKGKKKGGQKGHKGNTLKMVPTKEADEVSALKPERCKCGKRLRRQPMELHSRRQIFDIPDPKLFIHEFQLYKCSCPDCGRENYGAYPSGVKAPVQYGEKINSLLALLSVKYCLSHEKISELIDDLYGQPINGGTIQSSIKKAAEKSEPVVSRIKGELLKQPVVHLDETGFQVNNKGWWQHVVSNESWTYLHVSKHRGQEALKEGFREIYDYKGVLVHDCWSSYWGIKGVLHSLCGCHLLRELKEQMESGRVWAGQMHELLMELYKASQEGKKIHRRSYEWRRYKQICQLAMKEEPPPVKSPRGRPKKTKGRNLAERLEKYQEEVLRFAREDGVPFTNNQAERDFRHVKGKMKVAGCFRSKHGANYYALLQSLFSTWRKQGYNVFRELQALLQGTETDFLLKLT